MELTGSLIFVYMGTKLHEVFENLKVDSKTRPMLAMSIFKDCILIALEQLAKDPANESEEWARALQRKLNSIGVSLREDMELDELNRIAQKLFSSGAGVQKIWNKIRQD